MPLIRGIIYIKITTAYLSICCLRNEFIVRVFRVDNVISGIQTLSSFEYIGAQLKIKTLAMSI